MESRRNRSSGRSVRIREFDYSRVGMYFLTISAAEGRCIFGEIHGKNTVLTPIGEIAKACWIEIPQHFPAIKIETFAVMPNHIHGILTIEPDGTNANLQDKRVVSAESFGSPTAQSIPAIVRSYKSAATKRARESGLRRMNQSGREDITNMFSGARRSTRKRRTTSCKILLSGLTMETT